MASYDVTFTPWGDDNQTLTTLDNSSWTGQTWTNYSRVAPAVVPRVWRTAIIAVSCGLLIVGTILGNILVCSAIVIVRKLRTPSNLLIASLAMSDLLVAALVMPLAAVYEAQQRWTMGPLVCDMWTSLDVMLCTASILNLCAISIDRYLAITRPLRYAMKRNRVHMLLMIGAVWLLSAVISIPPLFGWKEQFKPEEEVCIVSQSVGYQIYATIGAFYLPISVMIVIYYRIYMVSSRIAKSEVHSRPSSIRQRETLTRCTSTLDQDREPDLGYDEGQDDEGSVRGGLAPAGPRTTPPVENGSTGHTLNGGGDGDDTAMKMLPLKRPRTRSTIRRFTRSRASFKTSMRERKATRTLGVIMGAFTACWLPFFIVALVKPFHPGVPQWLSSLFLWLGYTNSFLNPIIYARFNRDFRGPFKDILLCRCAGINMRQRCESYVEQYGTGSIRDSSRPLTTTTV